jgi:hypothetical protein
MIPFSFLTDPSTGDIDVSQGLRFTPDQRTYVVQRLDENLSYFAGEWFLDLREGVPYWERIIGAKPDLGLIDTLYRRAILATPSVASIEFLRLEFDRATRTLKPSFEATMTDGTTITAADLARGFFVNF